MSFRRHWHCQRLLCLAIGVAGCQAESSHPVVLFKSALLEDPQERVHHLPSAETSPLEIRWVAVEGDLPAYSDTTVGLITASSDGAGLLSFGKIAGDLASVTPRRLGRRGQGPGEVQFIGWVGACSSGETVMFDPARPGMLGMSFSDGTITDIALPYIVRHGTAVGCVRPVELLSLLSPPAITSEIHGLNRSSAALARFDSSGVPDTLVIMPGHEWWMDPESDWIPKLDWRDATLHGYNNGLVLLLQAASGEAVLIDPERRTAQHHRFEESCQAPQHGSLEGALASNLAIARTRQDKEELRAVLQRASRSAPPTRKFWSVSATVKGRKRFLIAACNDGINVTLYDWEYEREGGGLQVLGMIPSESRVVGETIGGRIVLARQKSEGLEIGLIH